MDNLDLLELSMDRINRRIGQIIAKLGENKINVQSFVHGDLDCDPCIELGNGYHIQLTDQFGGGLNYYDEVLGYIETLHFGTVDSIIAYIKEQGLCQK